jgi:hypothetical protein
MPIGAYPAPRYCAGGKGWPEQPNKKLPKRGDKMATFKIRYSILGKMIEEIVIAASKAEALTVPQNTAQTQKARALIYCCEPID